MILLETIKRVAEKATGWRRPNKPRGLVRERKPQTFRFKDDGLIPNHPRWPLIIYRGAVQLTPGLDPARSLKSCLITTAGDRSWRDGIYDYAIVIHASTKSSVSLGGVGKCNSAERTGVSSTSRPATSLSFRQARGINA
jgi:hypothetical protein